MLLPADPIWIRTTRLTQLTHVSACYCQCALSI